MQSCELQPYRRCKTRTRLVPKLKSVPICTKVPKEICNFDPHGSRRVVKKPLVSIYCRELQGDVAGEASNELGVDCEGDKDCDGIPDEGKSKCII